MAEFLASIAEKTVTKLSQGWHIREGIEEFDILFYEEVTDDNIESEDVTKIVFTKKNDLRSQSFRNVIVFDLSTKTYTKKRTDLEARIIRFLLPYRARFLPT